MTQNQSDAAWTKFQSGKAVESLSTPNKYSYANWFKLTSNSVVFRVKTSNEAHIALGTDCKHDGTHYEIVIGGWGNSKSVMRSRNQGKNFCEFNGCWRGIDMEFITFWISWDESDFGQLRVGYGTQIGEKLFMNMDQFSCISIKYMSVCTGWGSTGNWELFDVKPCSYDDYIEDIMKDVPVDDYRTDYDPDAETIGNIMHDHTRETESLEVCRVNSREVISTTKTSEDSAMFELREEIIQNEELYLKIANDTTKLKEEIASNEQWWRKYTKSVPHHDQPGNTSNKPNNKKQNESNRNPNRRSGGDNNGRGDGNSRRSNGDNNGDEKKDEDPNNNSDDGSFDFTNIEEKMKKVKTFKKYKIMKATKKYALTDTEVLALCYYTDNWSACRQMKKAHRCIIDDLPAKDSEMWKRLYAHCTTAVEKMYRVFHHQNKEFKSKNYMLQMLYHGSTIIEFDQYNQEQFFFKTLASFSTDRFVAAGFTGGQGMIFVIERAFQGLYSGSLRGADVSWISNFGYENEYIILPTTYNKLIEATDEFRNRILCLQPQQHVYIAKYYKTNSNPLLPHSDGVHEVMDVKYNNTEHEILRWLRDVVRIQKEEDQKKYYELLMNDGWETLEDIANIDVSTDVLLREIGITKRGHINKIKRNIIELRDAVTSESHSPTFSIGSANSIEWTASEVTSSFSDDIENIMDNDETLDVD